MAGNEVRGSVVVVTGGARGIGLATVEALVAAGAKVGVCDLDDVALKEAVDGLPGVVAMRADVTDPDEVGAFADAVEAAHGPVDVWVNNAGVMPAGPLVEESHRAARICIEVNVLGTIVGSKRALDTMVPRGRGHVVNVTSTAGEAAVPGLATYHASKWGALGFTLSLEEEVRRYGVRVSSIMPAFVATELTSGTGSLRGIPEVGPEDVAAAILRTIVRPRSKVYVPWQAAVAAASAKVLPLRAVRAVQSLLGADTALLEELDPAARRAYDERIGMR